METNKSQQTSDQVEMLPTSDAFIVKTPAGYATVKAFKKELADCVTPVGTVIYSALSVEKFFSLKNENNVTRWVLADGRNVTGSGYHDVTGRDAVPDLGGVFIRGKSHGNGLNPDGDLELGAFTHDKIESHNHEVIQENHSLNISQEAHSHTLSDNGHSHGGFDIVLGISNSHYGPGYCRKEEYVINGVFAGSTAPRHPLIDVSHSNISLTSDHANVQLKGTCGRVSIQSKGSNETAPKSVTLNAFIRID